MSKEIPATFTAETGWPGEDDCALVTSITNMKEWPLQFHRLPDVSNGVSAVSLGDGWSQFIEEQDLDVGAFLTFEVVDSRRLVVTHHRRHAVNDIAPRHLHDVSVGVWRNCSERAPPEAERSLLAKTDAPPKTHSADLRQFRKTLRKTHMQKHDSSRIVSASVMHCRSLHLPVCLPV